MEDWQQWQIRADQIAADLGQEVDTLQKDFFSADSDPTFRGFWPRFRDLKERVRTAPAIRLEAKLDLERRLRDLGSKAYKGQESAYARSGERKAELLAAIEQLRGSAESADNPRTLRTLRRDLDAIRGQFDAGVTLSPPDRQALWQTWRDASQFVWDRLTTLWAENETYLRGFLDDARQQLERSNAAAARSAVSRFFEALRTHEGRQATITGLKAEAEGIRQEANQVEERHLAERVTRQRAHRGASVEEWKVEYDRNREVIARVAEEVAALEKEFREAASVLDQALVRGTLVDKRRKLSDLERTNRNLEQRIEQAEDVPLISAG